jgi:hypothetical protein
MTSVNLENSFLFYQNPVDIFQTQNGSTQLYGAAREINSCKGCSMTLLNNSPASQYQTQKRIQNTVRVSSGVYTMNLAGLAGYQKPLNKYQFVDQPGTPYFAPARVYWNQMSDRARPAVQVTKVASGSAYHTSSTRHTITRNRPGAMSPGGVGVDIKHNSYDRYLNKIKGKSPLRRGPIPATYGVPIPFSRAFPIYGGKDIKTSIVNGCDCPDTDSPDNLVADKIIFGSVLNAIQEKIIAIGYVFHKGDFVWARKDSSNTLYKGIIEDIQNGIYTIRFLDDNSEITTTSDGLLIYFSCDCDNSLSLGEQVIMSGNSVETLSELTQGYSDIACGILNILSQSGLL